MKYFDFITRQSKPTKVSLCVFYLIAIGCFFLPFDIGHVPGKVWYVPKVFLGYHSLLTYLNAIFIVPITLIGITKKDWSSLLAIILVSLIFIGLFILFYLNEILFVHSPIMPTMLFGFYLMIVNSAILMIYMHYLVIRK